MSRGARRRLDLELLRRGMVASRDDARRAVEEMRVRVGGAVAEKPSRLVAPDEPLTVDGPPIRPYVSRGGEKLAAALDAFGVDPNGRLCLDVGASTGGFTDCLLQRGARRVFAVDAGRGQLHDRLRNDQRVVVMERTNARYITQADIGLAERPSLATIDVSFISATKVTLPVRRVVERGADVVLLIKPQFEVGRGQIGHGGIVRDDAARAGALDRVLAEVGAQGYTVRGVIESPLRGGDGNIEYLSALVA